MKTLTITAKDENLENLNTFIHSLLPDLTFLPEQRYHQLINEIDLAIEEIFVNIAHYAYLQKEEKCGPVTVQADFKDSILSVEFIDEGLPFNPLQRKDPDITLSAEKREIGGLGIFLTKKFMDKVTYSFEDNKNKLKIEKSLL